MSILRRKPMFILWLSCVEGASCLTELYRKSILTRRWLQGLFSRYSTLLTIATTRILFIETSSQRTSCTLLRQQTLTWKLLILAFLRFLWVTNSKGWRRGREPHITSVPRYWLVIMIKVAICGALDAFSTYCFVGIPRSTATTTSKYCGRSRRVCMTLKARNGA